MIRSLGTAWPFDGAQDDAVVVIDWIEEFESIDCDSELSSE